MKLLLQLLQIQNCKTEKSCRSGNRGQFESMVQRCNAAGVMSVTSLSNDQLFTVDSVFDYHLTMQTIPFALNRCIIIIIIIITIIISVIVDAVINHMTGHGASGTGTGGSGFDGASERCVPAVIIITIIVIIILIIVVIVIIITIING